MNNSEPRIVKTYFATNTLESNFPVEFTNAIGKKWIVVRGVVATINNGYIVSDLCLHASFIMRDNYLDSFVDFCNNIDSGSKPPKYEYPSNAPKTFRVWFTSMETDENGNFIEIVPDAFILKLLLIYEC